jgi:hypothetical protein
MNREIKFNQNFNNEIKNLSLVQLNDLLEFTINEQNKSGLYLQPFIDKIYEQKHFLQNTK